MKKKIIGFLLILLILSLSLSLFACKDDEKPAAQEGVRVVRAEESETGYATVYIPDDYRFTVLQLSDIQIEPFGRYGYVGADNEKTYAFVEKLLNKLKPDIAVANGDMVMSLALDNTDYMKRLADIFERTSTYWMPVYGNHDCQAEYTRKSAETKGILQPPKSEMTALLKTYPHCLISEGDAAGDDTLGNYFVNVCEESTKDIVYTVCAMDCAANADKTDYSIAKTAGQLEWYERHIKAISKLQYGEDGKVVKSLLYTHVGIPEFYTAYEEAQNDGNPTENYYYGVRLSGNYTSEKCGLFAKVLELQSTTAMFFAHHHDNDFSVSYKGVRLTFGQHSGFSHNYRTVKNDDGSVDFSRLTKYGDKRGGTEAALTKGENGYELTITPRYAAELFDDYADWSIDYAKVKADLIADGVTITE